MKTEKQLRAELARLNKQIAEAQDRIAAWKMRRDQLAALFPHKETPAPRITAPSVAIGH